MSELTPQSALILLAKSTINNEEIGITSIATETVFSRAGELGWAYSCNIFETDHPALSNVNYLLKTPDKDHLITVNIPTIVTSSSNSFVYSLYENTTVSAVGTEAADLIIANVNRASTKTNAFTITVAPTITSDGTLIFKTNLPSSAESLFTAFQLKSNTYYALRYYNPFTDPKAYSSAFTIFQIPNN